MIKEVGNRKVKIDTRTKSQTINIATEENKIGNYERTYRLLQPEVIKDEETYLNRFSSIRELYSDLEKNNNANLEIPDEQRHKTGNLPLYNVDTEWTNKNIDFIKNAINNFTEEFIKNKYLHRVEHSLHCELFKKLTAIESIKGLLSIGNMEVSFVQKEWPETVLREGNNVRGAYDLAILGEIENGANNITAIEYKKGLICPGIAIELGLEYGTDHLKQDLEKLKNSIKESDLEYGIICHYATDYKNNQAGVKEILEEYIADFKATDNKNRKLFITCCFQYGNKIFWKKLDDETLTEIDIE